MLHLTRDVGSKGVDGVERGRRKERDRGRELTGRTDSTQRVGQLYTRETKCRRTIFSGCDVELISIAAVKILSPPVVYAEFILGIFVYSVR